MNQSLTLAFLIAAGIGLVVQNTLMVRITQTSSTILIAMFKARKIIQDRYGILSR